MELSAHTTLIVRLLTQRDSGHDADTAMLCTQENSEQLARGHQSTLLGSVATNQLDTEL